MSSGISSRTAYAEETTVDEFLVTAFKAVMDNITGNMSYEEMPDSVKEFEYVVSTVVPIIFGLIVVIGLTGNFLVILTVISEREMRNTTNVLILNLAVADLIFLIICVPVTGVIFALKTWPFNDVMCKVIHYQ